MPWGYVHDNLVLGAHGSTWLGSGDTSSSQRGLLLHYCGYHSIGLWSDESLSDYLWLRVWGSALILLGFSTLGLLSKQDGLDLGASEAKGIVCSAEDVSSILQLLLIDDLLVISGVEELLTLALNYYLLAGLKSTGSGSVVDYRKVIFPGVWHGSESHAALGVGSDTHLNFFLKIIIFEDFLEAISFGRVSVELISR